MVDYSLPSCTNFELFPGKAKNIPKSEGLETGPDTVFNLKAPNLNPELDPKDAEEPSDEEEDVASIFIVQSSELVQSPEEDNESETVEKYNMMPTTGPIELDLDAENHLLTRYGGFTKVKTVDESTNH